MLQRIAGLSEAPLRRRINSRSLRLEALSVIVFGAAGAIGFAYFATQMFDAVEDATPNLEFFLLAEVITPIFLVVLFWFWYAIAAHFLAKFYGGRRPINRMFRATAWSLLPLGIWNLLRSIVVVGLFMGVDFPAQPEGVEAEAEVQNVLALGLEDPVYVGTLLLGVAFVAWSWHLLSIGVAEATEIALEDARRVAAVPAGTVALYFVWIALQWQGIL